jgi:hypothetical protein
MKHSANKIGSWLLAEQWFEQGDGAFVDEIRAIRDSKKLAAFATRWFEDRRLTARQLLIEYLNRPINAVGHEPLVKRLFKLAEKANDDELLGAFTVFFDRSVSRVLITKRRYDWRSQQVEEEDWVGVSQRTAMPRSNVAAIGIFSRSRPACICGDEPGGTCDVSPKANQRDS